jgi:hypothetical protein
VVYVPRPLHDRSHKVVCDVFMPNLEPEEEEDLMSAETNDEALEVELNAEARLDAVYEARA